jgi:hypothetical protein
MTNSRTIKKKSVERSRDNGLVPRTTSHTTIRAVELERFLGRLLNLRDNLGDGKAFCNSFTRFLGGIPRAQLALWWINDELNVEETEDVRELAEIPWAELMHKYFLLPLRNKLRPLWGIPHSTTADWTLLKIREYVVYGDPVLHQGYLKPFFFDLPKPCAHTEALDQALVYLQKNLRRTRLCQNETCPTPYFLALRSTAKYCNPECARPAQRESKRKWWRANRRRSVMAFRVR